LFCAPGPMLWQIRHFLNEVSPLATSCAIPAPVDVAISATATISVLVIMRPFPFGVGPALGAFGHAPLGRKFGPQPFKRASACVKFSSFAKMAFFDSIGQSRPFSDVHVTSEFWSAGGGVQKYSPAQQIDLSNEHRGAAVDSGRGADGGVPIPVNRWVTQHLLDRFRPRGSDSLKSAGE
jgi:hypothetical protein